MRAIVAAAWVVLSVVPAVAEASLRVRTSEVGYSIVNDGTEPLQILGARMNYRDDCLLVPVRQTRPSFPPTYALAPTAYVEEMSKLDGLETIRLDAVAVKQGDSLSLMLLYSACDPTRGTEVLSIKVTSDHGEFEFSAN